MDSLRCPSHDDGTFPERHALAQMPKDGRDAEDQVVRLAILPEISVDPGFQRQRFGIGDCFSRGDYWPNGAEVVERLSVAMLRA